KYVLTATGTDRLHQLGYTGRGVRVVVIGSYFGTPEERQAAGLPADTVLIDLTRELSRTLAPLDPRPGRAAAGLAAAQAVHLAAPGARLVLVRVDPAAPFQL